MEKTKLNVDQVISAHTAIITIMKVPGMEARKAYWLDRLKSKLESCIKKWDIERNKIVDKYATVIPDFNFIAPNEYEAFKKDLLACTSIENINDILEKYEKKSDYSGQRGIDLTRKKEFEEELCKTEEETFYEIEFNKIAMDENARAVLSRLSGNLQTALYFAFDGEVVNDSKIVVAQNLSAFADSKIMH